MASQPLKLGPFVGGMNTAADPTAVSDQELVDAVNFEVDLDASLVCRPPIVETVNNSGTWTQHITMIGHAIILGVNYVIGSNNDGTYAFDGTTWTTIKAGLRSKCAIQVQDFVFIVAATGSPQNGGYWDGTTWTVDANFPKGESMVYHKGRIFVAPGISATGALAHQLKYTDPISIAVPVPLTWSPTSVISVGQGNGENLIEVVIYNDNLVLFKQDSTYVLAYDVSPVDAVLRLINGKIGATTRFCVQLHESSIFLFHEANIFEIVNYDFQRVNMQVPFELDVSTPSPRTEEVFLSVVGDRLIVRYFNRIYVYGLLTKTWTRWESQSADLHNFGPLVEMPSNLVQQLNVKYFAGSSVTSNEKVYYIPNGYDASTKEATLADLFDIECTMLTKNYDLGEAQIFKRLFWWGVDCVTTRDIVGIVTPISAASTLTWDDLSTFTWDDLATWDKPLTAVVEIETDVPASTLTRKFVKFLKSLRWRQLNYRVTLLCDGTTGQGPCRLFALTAIVSPKQTVVKQVS